MTLRPLLELRDLLQRGRDVIGMHKLQERLCHEFGVGKAERRFESRI